MFSQISEQFSKPHVIWIITNQYQFGILKTSNLFPNTCTLKSSLVMIGTRSPRCLNLISASLNTSWKTRPRGKLGEVLYKNLNVQIDPTAFFSEKYQSWTIFFAQVWLCQWSRPDIYSTVKLRSLVIHQTAGFNTRYAANLNKPMYHDSVKGR